MKIFSPYFDQDEPEAPITGLIVSESDSGPQELDQIAVFKIKGKGYLVVRVSGCSCWPDRGTTDQRICHNKTEVDKAIRDFGEYHDYSRLHDKLQAALWHITESIKDQK